MAGTGSAAGIDAQPAPAGRQPWHCALYQVVRDAHALPPKSSAIPLELALVESPDVGREARRQAGCVTGLGPICTLFNRPNNLQPNGAEVFFHSLKRYRAIATRFEKTARNYLALIQLACSMLWLQDLLEGA